MNIRFAVTNQLSHSVPFFNYQHTLLGTMAQSIVFFLAYYLSLLGNSDLQLVDTGASPLLMGLCICLREWQPQCRGSLSAFSHSEGIEVTAASGFVNRDFFFFHTTPDLHSGKLFEGLREEGGRGEGLDRGRQARESEQGPARSNNHNEEEED